MNLLNEWNNLASQGLFETFACLDENKFRGSLRGFVDRMIAMGEHGESLGLAFSAGAHSLAVMSIIRKFSSNASTN